MILYYISKLIVDFKMSLTMFDQQVDQQSIADELARQFPLRKPHPEVLSLLKEKGAALAAKVDILL